LYSARNVLAKSRTEERLLKSIIIISSELPEIMGMSDRILVINDGQKKGELAREEITAEAIMRLAIS